MTAWLVNFLFLLFLVWIIPKLKTGTAKYFCKFIVYILFLIFFIQVYKLDTEAGVVLTALTVVGVMIGVNVGRG
jgi:hypothetical protein